MKPAPNWCRKCSRSSAGSSPARRAPGRLAARRVSRPCARRGGAGRATGTRPSSVSVRISILALDGRQRPARAGDDLGQRAARSAARSRRRRVGGSSAAVGSAVGGSAAQGAGGDAVGLAGGGHPRPDRPLAGMVAGHWVSLRPGPTHLARTSRAEFQGNARVGDPCPRRRIQRGRSSGSERAGAAAASIVKERGRFGGRPGGGMSGSGVWGHADRSIGRNLILTVLRRAG